MKRKMYMGFILILCLYMSLAISGCGTEQANEEETEYNLYYLNEKETKIEPEEYTPKAEKTSALLEEFTKQFERTPKNRVHKQLLPKGVEIEDYTLEDNILKVTVSEAYEKITRPKEILVRAGIVRTYTQIAGVEYVRIYVGEKELVDSKDNPIGIMNCESFVENSGKDINSYLQSKIKLYFANEAGDALRTEEKKVYYSSNVPIERVVVEQLLKGPSNEKSKPTIPGETKILGVTISDDVCYVNLNDTFAQAASGVDAEVAVYSIVNSIIDACHVRGVQLSINGECKTMFRDEVDLDQFFKRNKEVLEEE